MAEKCGIEPQPSCSPDPTAFQAVPITIRDTSPSLACRRGIEPRTSGFGGLSASHCATFLSLARLPIPPRGDSCLVPQAGFEPAKTYGLNVVAVPICICHRGSDGAAGGIRTLKGLDSRSSSCANLHYPQRHVYLIRYISSVLYRMRYSWWISGRVERLATWDRVYSPA